MFFTKANIATISAAIVASPKQVDDSQSGRRRRGAAADDSRPQRGAGGGEQEPTCTFSKKVLKKFRVERIVNGETILLRLVKRCGEWRWCPVVAVEDLPALFNTHHERATGFAGINKLYTHLRHNVPTQLAPTPEGKDRFVYGLEGFDRGVIIAFLRGCPVREDQQATKAAEQPAPNPIVVEGAFVHVQADLLDMGDGRDPRYRYVLMYVDLFTRHIWLRPLASKIALQIAREVFYLWMDTQVPVKLQVDNGSEFMAQVAQLAEAFGVQVVHGSVGNPQAQGCVERHNQTFKNKVSAQLMAAPTINWSFQARRIQKMINDEPAEALGGRMSRAQALFGALNPRPLQPPPEFVSNLLQLNSYAGEAEEEAAAPAVPAAAAPRKRAAKARGTKRTAAEAELPTPTEPTPPVRRSRRQAGSGMLGTVAAELAGGSEEEAEEAAASEVDATPTTARPRRRTAGSNPDQAGTQAQQGRLRRNAAALAAGAAAAAAASTEDADPAALAAAPSQPRTRRATAAAAAASAAQANPLDLLAEAGEQAAAEEAGSGSAAGAELPPHLAAVRQQTAVAQQKRAKRCESVRRAKGERKVFAVGDNVLLTPPKCGRVGQPVGPKKIVCRIVSAVQPYGSKLVKYKLRCNAGVIQGTFAGAKLTLASEKRAKQLQFAGVQCTSVAEVTVRVAHDGERGAAAIKRCGCRGPSCEAACPCRKGSSKCGRHCGCSAGRGGNCGNY